MAIVRVGDSGLVSGVGALNVTFAATKLNDTIVLIVETSAEFTGTPTGFTLRALTSAGTAASANGTEVGIFTKRAAAGETSVSVPDSGNHQGAVAIIFRGVSASAANDGVDTTTPSGGNTNLNHVDIAAATSANANELYFLAASAALAASVLSWSSTQTWVGGLHDSGTFSHSNGDGGALSYFYGTRAASGAMTGGVASVTRSTGTDSIVANGIMLIPAPTNTEAVTGTLGKIVGAANIRNKANLAIAGAIGAVTGQGAIRNRNGASVAGSLGKIAANALLKEGVNSIITGALGKIAGAVNVTLKQRLAGVGTLGKIAGAVNLALKQKVAAAGTLGKIAGDGAVENKQGVLVAGALGKITADALLKKGVNSIITGTLGKIDGHVTLPTAHSLAIVRGTLGAPKAAAGIYLKPVLRIAGTLGAINSASRIKLPIDVEGTLGKISGNAGMIIQPTCYDVADDRRELILARLAAVLGDVEGIASFARNDPSVVESNLPALLLLDGDETAGVPRGWDKGRPAPFPMMISMRPEVYLFTEEGETAGPLLNLLQDHIVKEVLADAELQRLCRDKSILYEGSQVAFALGRALEGEMGLNFTFNYALDPNAVCAPSADDPSVTTNAREDILAAMARATAGAEGVVYFRRNEISRPESASPAAFMLDGDEFVDAGAYLPGRPPNVPKPATTEPEVYAVVNADPTLVGPELNRLRLMIVRTILNDPLLTRLSADRDIRYEGVQTGLALGRSMAGEMGLKFSVRYVLNP